MYGHNNEELTSFGKKVLSVIVKKWNRDKICDGNTSKYQNIPEQYTLATPRTQNKKVLTFQSKEAPIQSSNSGLAMGLGDIPHFEEPGIKFIDITHSQDPRVLENNYNIITYPLPRIPKANELVHTLDAPSSSHNTATTHHLLRKLNQNNFTDNISADATNVETTLNGYNKEANIDWQNMFDTELIYDVPINKIETNSNITAKNTSTVVTNPQETKNINPNEIIHDKLNKPNKFEIHTKEKQDKKKRKVQMKMTDVISKKVKIPSSESKNTYRKQKYTKTVKNWLNHVDPSHCSPPVNGQTSEDKPDTDRSDNSMIEYVIEKDKLISNKKTVQARLANRDGIMKFRKPKNVDSDAAADNASTMKGNISEPMNIVDNTETITNIKQNNSDVNHKKGIENKPSVKEKKAKRKFITPIKSQIPVKDVNYNIIKVDKDQSNIIDDAIDSDVLAVLIYSNGFSQLNNHHTEDTGEPAGLLLNVDELFYYFEGFHQSVGDVLKQSLEKNSVICFDGKSILIYLKSKYNLDTHISNIIDVKIGACILEPDSSVENFSDLQKALSFTPEFTAATECDLQKTAWYAIMLRECAGKLIRLLTDNDLWRVFVDIEMKLLPIIADMEYQGVEVDVIKLKSMEDTLLNKMRAVEQQCYQAAGKAFQINSTVQVRNIIYEELRLDAKCNVKIRETLALGAKSTSEAMLRSLISVHPLPKLILEYRHLHKAHATFLAGIAQHVKDGIVRPTWVQTAAVTGRIASNNPNLQAIPKTPFNLVLFPEGDASNETILFRSVYTSPAGWCVVAADFKHVECRVWANVAADGELLEALSAPDLFRQLAKLWLKKPESEISTEDRERTKRMVYATLYGAGCRKLMDILDLSYERTLAVMASFNRTFPSLKSFGNSVVTSCVAADGDLRTACGRRRRFRHITSCDQTLKAQAERQAVNFLVQGSAADLCKLAMVRSVEQLRASKVDFKLVLQIHDELVFHVKSEQLHQAAVIIKRAMEGCGRECGAGHAARAAADVSVPLPVQLSVGNNWAQTTEYTPAADRDRAL